MPKTTRAAYRQSIMDNPVHLMRYLKGEAVGGSLQARAKAVAAMERVSYETAKASIEEVDAYRKRNERGEFDIAVRDLVISAIPQGKETLHGLLAATELVEVKDEKTGKTRVREMEDKTTRLEAMRVLKELISVQQPKVPLIENNVNQSTQIANIGGAETNEERLRRLRAKAAEFNRLPPEVAGVPQHIDAGEGDDEGEEDREEED